MEPKFEQKQYTPEEIAELEKSRTISDAELLEGGAHYDVGQEEDKRLIATYHQKNNATYEGGEKGRINTLRKKILEMNLPVNREVRVTFTEDAVREFKDGNPEIIKNIDPQIIRKLEDIFDRGGRQMYLFLDKEFIPGDHFLRLVEDFGYGDHRIHPENREYISISPDFIEDIEEAKGRRY